jgi:hypothetical protein
MYPPGSPPPQTEPATMRAVVFPVDEGPLKCRPPLSAQQGALSAAAKAALLRAGGCLLVEIASVLGFASQSHFSGVFRKVTGMSPGRFRQDVALSKIPQSPWRSRRFLAENRLVMRVDQPIAAIFLSDIKSVPHRHDLKASLILLSDHELTRTTGRSDRAGNHVWAF